MTCTTQYSVPPKNRRPVSQPCLKRRQDEACCDVAIAVATMSGASATQADAGCPKRGKLAASRTPERAANA